MFYVALLDFLVDVDIVLVQDLGIVQRLQDWCLESIYEERVLVGRLKATDQGVELLSLTECPVEEA